MMGQMIGAPGQQHGQSVGPFDQRRQDGRPGQIFQRRAIARLTVRLTEIFAGDPDVA